MIGAQLMKVTEYPALFQVSDSLANNSQRNHLRLIRTKVALLIAVGVISAITWDQGLTLRIVGGILLTTFLVLSIALTSVTHEKKFEEIWFNARALAESTKTETWNFLMQLDPYDKITNENDAENYFLEKIREIFHSQKSISFALTNTPKGGTQITSKMKQIRNETFERKKEIYLQDRIRNQENWYSNKAELNRKRASQWLYITWTAEVLAVVLAVLTILVKIPIVNPVGIVSSASAGILSWLTSKSYAEANQSYCLVAHDLAILQDEAKRASTADELGKVILKVENSINQEHRVWLGRLI
jgi:hypothetical protein